MASTAPGIWADGALAARHGAAFLSVSEPTFLTIARAQKWPRKILEGTDKVVYPKAAIVAYLSACPDAAPLGERKPTLGNAAKIARKKQEAA